MKIILLVLDPEAIIFGDPSPDRLIFSKIRCMKTERFSYPKSVEKIKILTSELDNVGILGAGALCITVEK